MAAGKSCRRDRWNHGLMRSLDHRWRLNGRMLRQINSLLSMPRPLLLPIRTRCWRDLPPYRLALNRYLFGLNPLGMWAMIGSLPPVLVRLLYPPMVVMRSERLSSSWDFLVPMRRSILIQVFFKKNLLLSILIGLN